MSTMSPSPDTNAETEAGLPAFGRRFGAPLLLGLVGLFALAFHLHGQLGVLPRPPQLEGLPLLGLVLLTLLSPLLLLLGASALGAALAHRIGLGSRVAGTAPGLRGTAWRDALLAAAVLAFLLRAADALLQPHLDPEGLMPTDAPGLRQLLLGVFYGGLTEEVMTRWGLLSLIAWVLHRLRRGGASPAGPGVLWTANVLAALLFAAGHLPALLASVEPSAVWIGRTLVLNTVAGIVYGWLYLRHQLEAAMAAHALTHVGLWLLGWTALI